MQETEAQKRERRHREDLERLRGFRPIDDTFMRGLFKDNIPLAELVLRIIVGKPDLTLVKCETQADLKRVTGARSVCLDAYATERSTTSRYSVPTTVLTLTGQDTTPVRWMWRIWMRNRNTGNCRTAMLFSSRKMITTKQANRYMSFRT